MSALSVQTVILYLTAYSVKGELDNCDYECHCAVDSECAAGICPSGCDKGPLGYNWGGPGCQIGN